MANDFFYHVPDSRLDNISYVRAWIYLSLR